MSSVQPEPVNPVRTGPVHYYPWQRTRPEPTGGTALCLSGGGYRAMLFHAGTILRLNQARLLAGIDRVSSVSGGSITAGVLAMNWNKLGYDNNNVCPDDVMRQQVVDPLRTVASQNFDRPVVLRSMLRPGRTISETATIKLDNLLFHGTKLDDLPDSPRFVFNAANLGSGALVRFEKAYLADYRVGMVNNPDVKLADAVAASGAFPPFLSPHNLDLRGATWTANDTYDLAEPEYRNRLRLTDGGVYDNLALETAYKSCRTLYVSDGGLHLQPQPHPRANWFGLMLRVFDIDDNQVRALRKEQLVQAFQDRRRDGVYVGISTSPADYGLTPTAPVNLDVTLRLALLHTRLKRYDPVTQKRLINWGYTCCDLNLRAWQGVANDGTLPYPDAPLT